MSVRERILCCSPSQDRARQAGEARIGASGIDATILRPWYVLGPGHRWAYLLAPFYAILTRLPATREGALRLGLITLEKVVLALIACIEQGPLGTRVLDVPDIRRAAGADFEH